MPNKQILIIHPNDKTTSFLNRIKNYLVEKFEDRIHHFNIYPNDDSHKTCLDRIRNHPSDGLIIFLGHGRTDKLYGSKGDLYHNKDLVSPDAIEEDPSKYYFNDNFINEENIDVFSDKRVFCLACNSNNKISTFASDKGVNTFFGFGNIPTSRAEFEEDGIKNVSNDMVKFMKSELNLIIKKGLEYGISNNYNFRQLMDIIHLIINQRIAYYLKEEKHLNERRQLVDYLYLLKKEMRIVGDKNLKLLS